MVWICPVYGMDMSLYGMDLVIIWYGLVILLDRSAYGIDLAVNFYGFGHYVAWICHYLA